MVRSQFPPQIALQLPHRRRGARFSSSLRRTNPRIHACKHRILSQAECSQSDSASCNLLRVDSSSQNRIRLSGCQTCRFQQFDRVLRLDQSTSQDSASHTQTRSPRRSAPAGRTGYISPSSDRSRASSPGASPFPPGTTAPETAARWACPASPAPRRRGTRSRSTPPPRHRSWQGPACRHGPEVECRFSSWAA
jgi:hypothetical protein